MFSITFFGYKGFPTRKCILSKNIKGCHKRSLTIVKNVKRKKLKSLTKPHTKTKKRLLRFLIVRNDLFKKLSFLKRPFRYLFFIRRQQKETIVFHKSENDPSLHMI